MTTLTGSRRTAATAFILVTAALDIVSLGIVIPVLPALIREFTGSNAQAGWVNGAFVALWAAMQFLVSPLIGSLSDRFGRRPMILASCAGMAADWVLMALVPNLWWLAVGRVIAGVTSSSFTTVFAYMADITETAKRARAYGLIGAAFSGGFILGPLIGGALGEWSPRTPFWFAAALSAAAFLYGLLILPESLPAERRMAFSWARANPLGALRLLLRHGELTGLACVSFLVFFSHHVFSAVFVLYAEFRYGWTPFQVGMMLALVGALDVAVQGLAVGRAVERFGDRKVMVFGLIGGAVGTGLMGLAPTGLVFLLATLPNALWGFAMPTLQSLMTRRVTESEQGQLQGANNSVNSVAGVVSPLFFGAVYTVTVGGGGPSAGTAFLIAAGVLLAAAITGAILARRFPAEGIPAGGPAAHAMADASTESSAPAMRATDFPVEAPRSRSSAAEAGDIRPATGGSAPEPRA